MLSQTRHDELLDELHAGLAGRPAPADVAALILELLGADLGLAERSVLTRAARGAGTSLMPVAFDAPIAPTGALASLAELIGSAPLTAAEAADPEAVRALVQQARRHIGLSGGRDFKTDRADRAARRAAGIELSSRRYNKIFRLIVRLGEEASALEVGQRLFALGRFAKTGFAAQVTRASFADAETAAFVAYLGANLARRALFTPSSQARALDQVAALLLARCEGHPGTDWRAVAAVFPRADVLAHLDVETLLGLLAETLDILRDCAAELEATALANELDLETMVVAPGNDSSTWNALAGAWNRARDYWLALVAALDSEAIAEAFLPGKVMRVMAADVVAWHRASGGDLHPDTRVAAALPRPWDVLAGRASCTRADVEAACRAAGVDPVRSGWTAARERTAVAAWAPTPESVHGVTVAHPALAAALRAWGAFSGKPLRASQAQPGLAEVVDVVRERHIAAVES